VTQGARILLFIAAGQIVWSVCFVVLYGGLSLGCAAGTEQVRMLGTNLLTLLLTLLWLAHVAIVAWLLRLSWQRWHAASDRPGTFHYRTATLANVVALAATFWIGFPIAITTPCT
jgi:hypothetical protein